MIASERYQFLVQTLVLGTRASYLYPPLPHYRKNGSDSCGGDTNCDNGCYIDRTPLTCGLDICHFVSGPDCAASCACDIDLIQIYFDTLLDRATSLYSINGPRQPGTADGSDYDRIYLGFDSEGTIAIRNYRAAGGSWVDSNDPLGPHDPFNRREDIAWGYSIITGNNGPTRHHWGNDGDLRTLCLRLGVGLVTDPSVVEVTTSYNWLHDANPTNNYGGRLGYQIAEDHLGPGQYDWVPAGCPWTPPASDYVYTHEGLGPSGCAGGSNSAAFSAQGVPTTMNANQRYDVWIRMRNNGGHSWWSEIGYRLGSQNPQDNFRWGFNRVELPAPTSPGHEVTFNFTVTAPSSPGNYDFQWRMLREGVTWFGDYTPNVVVNVLPGGSTYSVNFRCSNGKYVVAENGGGGAVNCNRDAAGEWETFTLIDLNGGELSSRHAVNFQTSDRAHYLQAFLGGGDNLNANPTQAAPWETFYIEKDGDGPIRNLDSVHIRTWSQQHFWVAEEGGGREMNANRTQVGPWETLTIVIR